MILKETDLQAEIAALRADVQALRTQLAAGVGVPDFRGAANGDALTIAAGYPAWNTPPAVVTAINVTSPITSTGGSTPTVGHANSGVGAGTYALATVTVNATGHVTGIAAGSAGVTSVTASAPLASSGGATPNVTHGNSGVSAGTYMNATVTVNASGHVTFASSGSGGSAAWGSITGTLSSQTDLNSALNARGQLAAANTWTAVNGLENASGGSYGGQFYVRNTSGGATAPYKWFRVNPSGTWEIINSAFSAVIFSLSDTGAVHIPSLTLSSPLPIAQGGTGSTNAAAARTALGAGTVTSVSAGAGMNFTAISGSGSVAMGTPSTCTAGTGNSASGTTHTHAISGFMPTTGGTFTGAITAPGITDSSDARFKRDMRTLHDGVQLLRKLKPMRFWNTLTEREDVGFIAQDVREVLPEVVTTDDNGDLAVAYQRLVAPTVAAVQVLDVILDQLIRRIQRLEAR